MRSTTPTLATAAELLSTLTHDARTNLEEIGCATPGSVLDDLRALCTWSSRSQLLAECLDGVETGDAARNKGWTDYVDAVCRTAVTLSSLDPKTAAEDDVLTLVNEGYAPAALAAGPYGADEALISAMGREWVMRTAGATDFGEAEWDAIALPWCRRYSDAYRAKAAELASGLPT